VLRIGADEACRWPRTAPASRRATRQPRGDPARCHRPRPCSGPEPSGQCQGTRTVPGADDIRTRSDDAGGRRNAPATPAHPPRGDADNRVTRCAATATSRRARHRLRCRATLALLARMDLISNDSRCDVRLSPGERIRQCRPPPVRPRMLQREHGARGTSTRMHFVPFLRGIPRPNAAALTAAERDPIWKKDLCLAATSGVQVHRQKRHRCGNDAATPQQHQREQRDQAARLPPCAPPQLVPAGCRCRAADPLSRYYSRRRPAMGAAAAAPGPMQRRTPAACPHRRTGSQDTHHRPALRRVAPGRRDRARVRPDRRDRGDDRGPATGRHRDLGRRDRRQPHVGKPSTPPRAASPRHRSTVGKPRRSPRATVTGGTAG